MKQYNLESVNAERVPHGHLFDCFQKFNVSYDALFSGWCTGARHLRDIPEQVFQQIETACPERH